MKTKTLFLLGALATTLTGLATFSTADADVPTVVREAPVADVPVAELDEEAPPMSLQIDPLDAAEMTDCFNCGSGSDGACGPQSGKARIQCTGSRSDCRSRGCHITGTSSCSSAGNVGRC